MEEGMAQKRLVESWLAEGKSKGATHVIIATDQSVYEDYPVFITAEQDVEAEVRAIGSRALRCVREVYNLKMPLEPQLAERRPFNIRTSPVSARA